MKHKRILTSLLLLSLAAGVYRPITAAQANPTVSTTSIKQQMTEIKEEHEKALGKSLAFGLEEKKYSFKAHNSIQEFIKDIEAMDQLTSLHKQKYRLDHNHFQQHKKEDHLFARYRREKEDKSSHKFAQKRRK